MSRFLFVSILLILCIVIIVEAARRKYTATVHIQDILDSLNKSLKHLSKITPTPAQYNQRPLLAHLTFPL